jgi:hypothetical protein
MLDNAALATNLESMAPTTSEATAIANLSEAYRAYCAGAQANGVPISGAVLAAAKTAMQGALVGLSTTGAVSIQAGCVAFWASVALGLASSFTGALAITPPTCAALSAALTATFAANVAANKTLPQAAEAVADAIHLQTAGALNTNLPGVGTGTVTFPGAIVAPII